MLIFHFAKVSPKPTRLMFDYPQVAMLYLPEFISIIRQEIMQPATLLRHQADNSGICWSQLDFVHL